MQRRKDAKMQSEREAWLFDNLLASKCPPPHLSLKPAGGKVFGFTLAEVLISLGIIGVIAAMTIPNLFHDTSKQETVTKLEKEYTSLSQAIKMSEIDNGNNATWDWGTPGDTASTRTSFDKYWAPYLRISKYCNTYQECGYSSPIIKYLNGQTAILVGDTSLTHSISVLLADGSLIMIYQYDINTKLVFIDVNGSKGPNVYGKDVFQYNLDEKRGLIPPDLGTVTPGGANSDCKTNGHGWYCSTKIIYDNWLIKDDYPW